MTLRLVSFFTIKIREFLKAICLNQEPTPSSSGAGSPRRGFIRCNFRFVLQCALLSCRSCTISTTCKTCMTCTTCMTFPVPCAFSRAVLRSCGCFRPLPCALCPVLLILRSCSRFRPVPCALCPVLLVWRSLSPLVSTPYQEPTSNPPLKRGRLSGGGDPFYSTLLLSLIFRAPRATRRSSALFSFPL